MKAKLVLTGLLAFLLAAASGEMLVQGGGGYNEFTLDDTRGGELLHDMDFDGDGFQDVVILKNGELTVGYGHAQVSVIGWDYVTKQQVEGTAESSTLESYDLDGDGNDDLIVTSYSLGTVHVVSGQISRSAPLRVERFEVGQGPVLGHHLPGVLLHPSQTKVIILSAQAAGNNPEFRRFEPAANRLVTPVDQPWDTADDEPGLPGVTIYLDLNNNARQHVMGTVQGKEFQYYSIELINANGGVPGLSKLGSLTLKRGYRSTVDFFAEGERGSLYFANYAPGVETLEMVGIDLETFIPEVDDEVVVGFQVGDVKVLPRSGGTGDQLLITSLDGLQAAIFDYDSARGLTLFQQLPSPPLSGAWFGKAVPVVPAQMGQPMHIFFSMMGLAAGEDKSYSVYTPDASGQFQITASEIALPALAAYPQSPTVALKTADPFNYSPTEPFDFEFLSAGDFSTMASFGGGQVSATVETFLGTLQGLGNPQAVQLQPDDNPGAGGTAVPNSWEVSSSVTYQVAPGGGGVAAVSIDPPSGTYGGVIEINFAPSPGTTPISRIGNGPWQSGNGPFLVGSDTIVEYYGEHVGGAISPIQSANYDIVISAEQDSNGDGINDLIAAALGLDIAGGGDTDGDEVSDVLELLNDSDPLDPASIPASIDTPFPPSLEMVTETSVPVSGGGDTAAPKPSEVMLFSSLAREMDRADVNNQGRASLGVAGYFNRAVQGEPPLREDAVLFVGWQHRELRRPEFAALLGIGFPQTLALPSIPPPPPVPLPPVGPVILIPYPDMSMIAEWIEESKTIIGGFKSMSGMDSESEVIEINIETTLTALAYATWVRNRLEAAGRGRPAFPWDDFDFGRPLSNEDLAFLEEPQGPGLVAHELTHVVEQIHQALTQTPALAPLIQSAREIYLAWEKEYLAEGNANQPVVIGSFWNGVDVMTEFFENGVIHPDYADDVTTPVGQLVALRDLLLAVPAERPVLDISGTLGREPGTGNWVVQHNQTDLTFLRERARSSTVVDPEIIITGYRPFQFPFDVDAYEGAEIQVIGFSTGDPGEIIVHQFILETDLATDPANDTDFDGLDDEYERRYLTDLAAGFWDDSDLDGFANGREYREGTNAGDPHSFPSGDPELPQSMEVFFEAGGNLVIEWMGSEEASYVVSFATDDLGVFTPSTEPPVQPIPGVPFYQWSFEPTEEVPHIYFRVETSLNP